MALVSVGLLMKAVCVNARVVSSQTGLAQYKSDKNKSFSARLFVELYGRKHSFVRVLFIGIVYQLRVVSGQKRTHAKAKTSCNCFCEIIVNSLREFRKEIRYVLYFILMDKLVTKIECQLDCLDEILNFEV